MPPGAANGSPEHAVGGTLDTVARFDITLKHPGERLGLQVAQWADGRVYIKGVVPGSAGDRAGVALGHLLSVDGQPASSMQAVQDAIAAIQSSGRTSLSIEVAVAPLPPPDGEPDEGGVAVDSAGFTAGSGQYVQFRIEPGGLGEYLDGERVGLATAMHFDPHTFALTDQDGSGGVVPRDAAAVVARIARLCAAAGVPHDVTMLGPLAVSPHSVRSEGLPRITVSAQRDGPGAHGASGGSSSSGSSGTPRGALAQTLHRAAESPDAIGDSQARQLVLRAPAAAREAAVEHAGGSRAWKGLSWQQRLGLIAEADAAAAEQHRLASRPAAPRSPPQSPPDASLRAAQLDAVAAARQAAAEAAAAAAAATSAAQREAALAEHVAELRSAVHSWQSRERAERAARRAERGKRDREAKALAEQLERAAELGAQRARLDAQERALAERERSVELLLRTAAEASCAAGDRRNRSGGEGGEAARAADEVRRVCDRALHQLQRALSRVNSDAEWEKAKRAFVARGATGCHGDLPAAVRARLRGSELRRLAAALRRRGCPAAAADLDGAGADSAAPPPHPAPVGWPPADCGGTWGWFSPDLPRPAASWCCQAPPPPVPPPAPPPRRQQQLQPPSQWRNPGRGPCTTPSPLAPTAEPGVSQAPPPAGAALYPAVGATPQQQPQPEQEPQCRPSFDSPVVVAAPGGLRLAGALPPPARSAAQQQPFRQAAPATSLRHSAAWDIL